MKIYLANGLFSEADVMYNDILIDQFLAMGYEVYAPQRNTAINDKTKSADSIAIFDGDTAELESSDIIVAVLDGIAVDPGVAAEIGYMAAKGKRIYGLLTDSRESSKTVNEAKVQALKDETENQFVYVNLYVVGAIKKFGRVFTSRQDLMIFLQAMKPHFDSLGDEEVGIYKKGDSVLITSYDFGIENEPAVILQNGWYEDDDVIMYVVENQDKKVFNVMESEITGKQDLCEKSN